MNAGERQALRQVVRQRMKVLRSDVAARKAELEAEVEQRVASQYAARDKLFEDLGQVIAGILDQARKDIRAAYEKVQSDHPDAAASITYDGGSGIKVDNKDRYHMSRRLHAEIDAQVSAALTRIDRQEADLVEEITVDGLETDAAKNFLSRIPTVGELVPATRMREITA